VARAVDVVGLCGSLRAGSVNRLALRLAGATMPPAMRLDVLDWRGLPVYDGDAEAHGLPDAVVALQARIAAADAVVIASPEYNHSIPGAFKNVLDWLSRGAAKPLAGKPVALLSASPGPLGGARVQYDLRRVLAVLEALPMTRPELFIGSAAAKFDAASGECTDEATRRHVAAQMAAFEAWIAGVRRMRGG
jgi:chromate reductase